MKRDPLLWAGVAAYWALFVWLGSVRYALHRNFVDLGIFAQTTVSAFGCFCNPVEGSHWAYHFSPILYVVGALMQIWRSPLTLIAVQALAGALTAPPVYGILARRTDRRTARLGALVVLLYPPLAGAIFNDFHENGLAAAAVAWLLWAFDGRRPVLSVVFLAATLAVKEDQALFVFIAALAGAFAYRADPLRVRLCILAGASAAACFTVFFLVIQPHAAHLAAAGWAPSRFYAWTGADRHALFPRGVLERLGFIVLAFAPLCFLPFRTPAVIAVIAPIAEVLASRMSTTYTTGSHYAGAWSGWVFYAYALGAAAVWSRSPRRAATALYVCVALCTVEFAVANPLHPGYFLRGDRRAGEALDAFVGGLRSGISLATQEEAYTHLAATNPNVTVLPESQGIPLRSCYVLTDSAYPESARLVESAPLVARLVRERSIAIVKIAGPITLYKAAYCR